MVIRRYLVKGSFFVVSIASSRFHFYFKPSLSDVLNNLTRHYHYLQNIVVAMSPQRTVNDVITAGKAVSQVWGRPDEKIRYRHDACLFILKHLVIVISMTSATVYINKFLALFCSKINRNREHDCPALINI